MLTPMGLSALEQGTIVRMETPLGKIDIELFDDTAPQTVANFLKYVNDGDYTNSFIHRSVPGLIIQGGGFTFVNNISAPIPADPPVINEFNHSNIRGTIAMAKFPDDPDSATSQWFFNLVDNSEALDTQNGGFTVFGQVIGDGMDVVDAIDALPVWPWVVGGAFTNLPLIDYPGTGPVLEENLVMIYRVFTLSIPSESFPWELFYPAMQHRDKQ